MNRDTVVGIVGAVILVTAMVGVFLYERNAAVGPVGGSGTPTLQTVDGPALNGTTAVGAESDATVDINATGLQNVTFTLTWRATQGRDTMRLTVAPPTGSGVTEGAVSPDENDGEITVTVPVVNADAAGTNGTGAWKVTVTFVRAEPATPVTPPVAPPGTTDANVAWSVASRLQAFNATAAS